MKADIRANNSKKSKLHRYFISFPFGLGEYIPNMLENELQNVQVQNVFSTHAVFLTSDSRQTIMNLPFASQIYIYIKQFNHPNVIAPEKQLRWAVEKPTFIEALRGISYKFQKYRIFGQSDSETISLPKALKRNFIEKLEYYEDIRFDNENPEAEIWFVEANKDSKPNGEKVGLCGIKISSHPDYHHTLKKGELRPEIAYFLNFLAEPVKRGTMLDPFAGSGAIPISAAENFNYREIIVGDKDLAGFNENLMKWKSRFNEKIIKVQEFDATQMKTIKDNTIDRIVTDPPW
jgi:23S rRNA G2445 N2-methylase RlmL